MVRVYLKVGSAIRIHIVTVVNNVVMEDALISVLWFFVLQVILVLQANVSQNTQSATVIINARLTRNALTDSALIDATMSYAQLAKFASPETASQSILVLQWTAYLEADVIMVNVYQLIRHASRTTTVNPINFVTWTNAQTNALLWNVQVGTPVNLGSVSLFAVKYDVLQIQSALMDIVWSIISVEKIANANLINFVPMASVLTNAPKLYAPKVLLVIMDSAN